MVRGALEGVREVWKEACDGGLLITALAGVWLVVTAPLDCGVTGLELGNFEANDPVEGIEALVTVASGDGREFKLVTGVIAMKEGDARALELAGEKVEDVETVGEEDTEVEMVLVEERVAGLIISYFGADGAGLDPGEFVLAAGFEDECSDRSRDLLNDNLSRPEEDFEGSCLET